MQNEYKDMSSYSITEGDRVYHYKEPEVLGVVTHIDYYVIKCNVIWDDQPDEIDIQWLNDLVVVTELIN